MALLEAVESAGQPLGGYGGRRGDGQSPGVVVRLQAPDRRSDAGKGLGEPGEQNPSRSRQFDRSVHSKEQLDPEILLQRMDLMTDRGWRNMELIGSLAEAHMPCRRFKCPQCAKRWEMAVHQAENS